MFQSPGNRALFEESQDFGSQTWGTYPYICPSAFRLESHLNLHKRNVHRDAGQCQCKNCGKLLANPRQLELHMSRIHSGSTVKCDIGDKSFGDQASVNNHIRLTHAAMPALKGKIRCSICKKSYAGQRSLDYHVESKSGRDLHRSILVEECLKNAATAIVLMKRMK